MMRFFIFGRERVGLELLRRQLFCPSCFKPDICLARGLGNVHNMMLGQILLALVNWKQLAQPIDLCSLEIEQTTK